MPIQEIKRPCTICMPMYAGSLCLSRNGYGTRHSSLEYRYECSGIGIRETPVPRYIFIFRQGCSLNIELPRSHLVSFIFDTKRNDAVKFYTKNVSSL